MFVPTGGISVIIPPSIATSYAVSRVFVPQPNAVNNPVVSAHLRAYDTEARLARMDEQLAILTLP